MSRQAPLDLTGDSASCAGAALGLREIARLLEAADAPLSEVPRSLAAALDDFAEALRDSRATAFRAERVAQAHSLQWRGRTVCATDPATDPDTDPDAVPTVHRLVNRATTRAGKAAVVLRRRCAEAESAAAALSSSSRPTPHGASASTARV